MTNDPYAERRKEEIVDTKKIRACSYLLPDPGGEVVRECVEEIERLRRTQMNWQPIETALNDETPILAFDGDNITSVIWDVDFNWWEILVPSEGYRDSDCIEPTHWMPLPEPPTKTV